MANEATRLSELVAQVAAAYFANSHVSVADIPTVMRSIAVGLAVDAKRRPAEEAAPAPEASAPPPAASAAAMVVPAAAPQAETQAAPAAPEPQAGRAGGKPSAAQVRGSIRHDALISFEDGRPYKMLRLHLKTHGLTPDEYRRKWGLPDDYPMTAASHSAARSAIARRFGFGGRKPRPVGRPRKR
jgi:predicted transcriptional regulator